MPAFRVKGLNKVVTKRGARIYYYHRKSGRRITAEPGSAEFWAQIAAAEGAVVAKAPKAGTLGHLIDEYRASKFFLERRLATRQSYDRAIDQLKPLRDLPLHALTGGYVAALRDKMAAGGRGRWIVNYTLTVLGILCDFAVEKEWMQANPLGSVRKLPRAADAPKQNRPWRPEECRAVIEAAAPELRVAIGLAMFVGLRRSDIARAPKTAIRGGTTIEMRTQKRNKLVRVPIHPELARILAEAPRHEATTIAANSRGAPWTLSGLDTAFQRLIAKLEEADLVSDGLTLHGLRHTLATRLKEAGVDEETRADLLGHNLAMSRHYSEEADTSQRDRKLIAAADLFGNRKRRGVAKRAGKSAKQRASDDDK